MAMDEVVGGVAMDTDIDASPQDATLFDNHLSLAAHLREWAAALQIEVGDERRDPRDEADFLRGYVRALSDLAGHLSVGDGLPGGLLEQHA